MSAGAEGASGAQSDAGAGGPGGTSGRLAVVTGASGFVGSHIVDELLRHGDRVRCLVRPGSPTRWLDGKPVEIVRLGYERVEPIAEALRGASWIVHAAGLTRARSAKEFHEANVTVTERVLRAATSNGGGIGRFVLVSSQAAAGPADMTGRPVTETDRPDPVSPYGVSKLRAEELTLLLREKLPVVVIRPPAVYGPRDNAVFRLFLAVKRHVIPVLRNRGRFSIVYVEDLARAVRLALAHPKAPGQVYFVGGPDVTDYDELGEEVREAMGTWAVRVRPPGFVLETAAVVAETFAMLLGRAPLLSREKLAEITSGDWICSSAKIRSQLGWEPEVSLEEGVRRTASWYREAGWL
jgi:nucleoside-diphosphate-sugar epimerase